MSPELRRYLNLEHAMVELDAHGNSESDLIRDYMDGAWRDLSAADREWLNARQLPPLARDLHVSVGAALFVEPSHPNPASPGSWEFADWRRSAA